jgi:hypothetical protein
MWVLRVYSVDNDELVAEHDLGTDDAALARILQFEPSKAGSTLLDAAALTTLKEALPALRQPGSKSWENRDWFIDFDAEPLVLGAKASAPPAPAAFGADSSSPSIHQ